MRSRRAPAKSRGRESTSAPHVVQAPDIRAFLARAPSGQPTVTGGGGDGERRAAGAETTSSSSSPWLRRPDRRDEDEKQVEKTTKKRKRGKNKSDGDDEGDAAWTDLPAPVAAFQLPPFLFRASVAAVPVPSPTSSKDQGGGDEPSEEVEDASLSSTWDGSPPASPPSGDAERQCGGLVVRLKSPPTSATTIALMHQRHRSAPAVPQSLEEDKEEEEEGADDRAQGRDRCRDKQGESDGRTGKAQAGGGKGGRGVLEGEARHLRVLKQHVAHHSFFRQHDAAERAKNDLAQGQNRLFDLWDSLAPATPTIINSSSLPPTQTGVPSSTAAALPLAQREATATTATAAVIAAKAGGRKREQKDGLDGEEATPPPPKEPPRAQVGSFSFAFTLPSSSSSAAAAPPARKRTKKPTATTGGPKGTAKRKRTTDTAKPAAE